MLVYLELLVWSFSIGSKYILIEKPNITPAILVYSTKKMSSKGK